MTASKHNLMDGRQPGRRSPKLAFHLPAYLRDAIREAAYRERKPASQWLRETCEARLVEDGYVDG